MSAQQPVPARLEHVYSVSSGLRGFCIEVSHRQVAMHRSVDRLRRYRAGKLTTDELNELHARADADRVGGQSRGAARHWVIQDLLIRDVLACDIDLSEVADFDCAAA